MPAKCLTLAGRSSSSPPRLADFRDIPGAEQVEALLAKAAQANHPLHMTEVNCAEVRFGRKVSAEVLPGWCLIGG